MLTLPPTAPRGVAADAVAPRASEVPPRAIHPWRRPEVVAGCVALLLAVAYLLAGPTGEDLSAGLFRASFARSHPLTPVDLQWFGGTSTFGYSVWTSVVAATLGVTLTGAVCSVVATVQTTALLRRGGASRPLVGGVLAALTQTANLIEGRTAFGLGMVCGLGALLLLTGAPGASVPARRWVGAGALAALCGLGSPVAALLLWVCAGALVLCGSVRRGVVLLGCSLPPVLLVSVLFGDGGVESFSLRALVYSALATGAVGVVVTARTVRAGALVGLVMLVACYLVSSPVGDNSVRLSLLFAAPLVGAFVTWRPWLAALAVVVTAVPQNLAVQYSFTDGPPAHAAYYAPLLHEIDALGPLTGRVEIPETTAHWDAWFVGHRLPLARGWLRQLDRRLNSRVLFDGRVSPAGYETFLRRNAVQYVALPDAPLTGSGMQERRALTAGLPYLRRVWGNEHWSLWAVRDHARVVAAPGRLVDYTPATVTLRAPAASTVPVSLRWVRWLDVSAGACIRPGPGGHVLLQTTRAGRYVIGSRLDDPAATHCAPGTGRPPHG